MKKIFFVGIFALLSTLTFRAQVTIGVNQAPDPSAVLDLQSKGNLGLLLPRVVLTDTLVATPLATHVKGMFVYNTTPSADGKVTEGVYYDDGRRWWKTNAGGEGVTPLNNPTSPWLISGTTNQATSNTENIYQMGQVAIGTAAAADPTAALNVQSTDKGVLFPRIALKSPRDIVTIPNPTLGLMVYCTGEDPNFKTIGYVYWNGSEWRIFSDNTAIPPHISDLLCGSASLSPGTYKENIPYIGVMRVNYLGGNGGSYGSGAPITLNGLTFQLQGGKLDVGSGELVFNVTGTPTISSPSPTTFTLDQSMISFWDGSTCDVTVGTQSTAEIKTIAVMDYMHPEFPDGQGVYGFSVECNTPDGLYTIRAFLRHNLQNGTATIANNTQSTSSGANNNIQIRNNTNTTAILMWNYSTFYGAYLGSAGGNFPVPPKTWGGTTGDATTAWLAQTTTNYAGWGNTGIYNASNNGPEYRIYSWIDTSPDTKVSYIATIMAGMDPGAGATEATKQKVFIRIEQITAQ